MAGRRYSAGRIFLDVIPSFRGVVRETAREAEKLRQQVAKDNEKAAAEDEKGQARVRTRERVKGEKDASAAAAEERRKAWRAMTIEERREAARVERQRRAAFSRQLRSDIDQQVKNLDQLAKLNARELAKQEKARVAHEERVAKIVQGTWARQGQEMWKQVQDDAKKAALAREQAAREAAEAEERLERERLKRREQAARDELRRLDAEQKARRKAEADFQRRWESEMRASLKQVEKDLRAQGGRFGQDMRKAIGHALQDLPKIKIDDQGIRNAEKRIEGLRTQLVGLLREKRDLKVGADTTEVDRKIAAVQKALDVVQDRKVRLEADAAGLSEAERKIHDLRRGLESLASKRIGIDISGKEAFAELKRLDAAARDLDRRRYDIDVRTNAKGVTAILREQITVMRAASRGATDLGNRHRRAGRDSQDAANAFRIFSWRIVAIATLIPMLSPMIASLAGAIGQLIPMALGAGAGLGVLILGLTGLAPAVKALGDVQDNAAKDALAYEKTMRNAGRAVRDAIQNHTRVREQNARSAEQAAERVQEAQEGVVRAERDAAEAAQDAARRVRDARRGVAEATERGQDRMESALRRVRDSEQRLADAQRDSVQAQRDLQEAREDAERQLQDMAMRAAGGALAERQARLDLKRAQKQYEDSLSPLSTATDNEREAASIDYERAKLDLERIIRDNKDLAEERAEADKAGVEGSKQVQDAKERINAALQAERDAEEQLAESRRDAADAQVEAARDIADANERLTDAMAAQARQQRDSAESVADAQKAVADALRDQQRTLADNAVAMRDAHEREMDAQAAYQEALTQTGDIGSSSMQKLNEAMAALGPEGRAFALFLHSLREPLAQLRRDVQAGLLPGVQEFMQDMMDVYGPGFSRWAAEMGVVLGDIFRLMSEVFQNPIMSAFFDSMEKYAGVFTEQVAVIMLNLLQVIAGLSTAFAPFAVGFGDALVRITAGWAEWAGSLSESEGFYRFMDYVNRVGPIVVDLFVALGKALINLGIGLAPYGEMLITWATEFFTWVAEADPKLIGTIAAALIGLVLAVQLAAGAMTLLSGAGLFFSKNAAGSWNSPVALFIGGLILLVAAVAILRANFEGFREVTDKLLEKMREFGEWLWENRDAVLQVTVVVGGLAAGLYGLWRGFQLVSTALTVLRAGMVLFGASATLSLGWVALIVVGIAALVAALVWAWNNHEGFRNNVLMVWDQIKQGASATATWFTDTFVPWVQRTWDTIWNGLKWAWENIGRPIFNVIVAVVAWAWNIIANDILPIVGYAFKILWGVVQLVFIWLKYELDTFIKVSREAWDGKLGAILRGAGGFFKDFYENGIKPTFEAIGAVIAWFFDDVVKPVFRNVSKAIDTMVEAFRSGEGLIRGIWAGISDGLAGPIEFSVRFINNNMIEPLNDLLADINVSWRIPKLPDVKIPRYVPRERGAVSRGSTGGGRTGVGYAATGTAMVAGVLPGYSPGVDNIRFTSPFGDLMLGGGEGIIRPEVVRALTPAAVDALNAAAMSGGVDGVRRILGAHASGTSAIDFGSLPRAPRTDVVVPKAERGKSLWERFSDLVSIIRQPKRAITALINKLASFLPNQDGFVGKYLVGAMKKLAGAVGGKAEDAIGSGAQAVGNSTVNYGGNLGWAPGVPSGSWPTTWALIKALDPRAVMTSNYRRGAITASGYPSLHGLGRAVDVVSPDMAETFMRIRNARKWSQLYYSPMGNLQIGYRDATVHRTHFDHIHAAYGRGGIFDRAPFDLGLYDTGGILDHGDLALNLSGQPEAVLTNAEWKALRDAASAMRDADQTAALLDEDFIDELVDKMSDAMTKNRKALVGDLAAAGKRR